MGLSLFIENSCIDRNDYEEELVRCSFVLTIPLVSSGVLVLPPTVSNYFALATGLSLFTKNTSLRRKVDKNVRRGLQGIVLFHANLAIISKNFIVLLQTSKKLTAAQKSLSKVDKKGMKSLSSFFGAGTKKTKKS